MIFRCLTVFLHTATQQGERVQKKPPPDFTDHLASASSLWCVLRVYPCGINLQLQQLVP